MAQPVRVLPRERCGDIALLNAALDRLESLPVVDGPLSFKEQHNSRLWRCWLWKTSRASSPPHQESHDAARLCILRNCRGGSQRPFSSPWFWRGRHFPRSQGIRHVKFAAFCDICILRPRLCS